jgi:hypothetical protein
MNRPALVLLLLAPCLAAAQTPPAAPPQQPAGQQRPGGQPRGPRPAPTNLKALPKTTTGDEVIKLMRQYEGDLGVECEFCHAQDPTTHRNNFASDANPIKDTARYMIVMTAEINARIDDMPGKMYADPVTCGTCHRGEKHPSVYVPPARPQGQRPPGGGPPPATMPAPAVTPNPTAPHPSGR